jgi:basic amino acid/polyamine antiporter, APA family
VGGDRVHHAFGLIFYVTAFANSSAISLLGGTTSLLLLAVFALVNVAVLVLRRDVQEAGGHFKTPTALPVIGCLASFYLVTPLSGRPGQQYLLALILIGIGIVLFFITMLINRQLGIRDAGITDPHLGAPPD